jgi:hypothetical protein
VRLRLRPPSETADLRKYRKRSNWAQAHAGTRGQDRPTAATRCAKVRSMCTAGRATSKWLVRTLPADVERVSSTVRRPET